MPSSISSSKPGEALRALVYLLALIAIAALTVEIVTGVGFWRISRIQHRVHDEYIAARVVKRNGLEGRPTVLLVGNSLLNEGVDVPRFQKSMAPAYDGSRFVVEQTQFLDWYFGLRRLFQEGARPAVVVLFLNQRHLLAMETRGEYFAHFQMAHRDLAQVVREEHLDTTMASDYFFANWSVWWGSRTEIRKWLLGRIMPDLFDLTTLLTTGPGPAPPEKVVQSLGSQRFAAMKRLCDQYSARFILVIPPEEPRNACCEALPRLGQDAGVSVLVPYAPGEMPSNMYRDGFHLTPEGASLFTDRLAQDLLTELSR